MNKRHNALAWQQAAFDLCERLAIAFSPRIERALTHPSFANEHSGLSDNPRLADNQRLEFLGDSVIGLCVTELLMAAFPKVTEGDLTLMRAWLVNTDALAEAALAFAMGSALRLGRGADGAGARERKNVLADTVEAILGAVYLDQGLEGVRPVAQQVVATRLDVLIAEGGMRRDPKSRLQELLQALGVPAPRYVLVETSGPPHARLFTVAVELRRDGKALPELDLQQCRGEGRSKKLAQQAAARASLAQLEASR